MTAGKYFLEFRGTKTALPAGESLIGRGSDCAVRVDADGVQAVHAAVRLEGGRAVLEDRTKDLGTKVNGQPLAVADIKGGDEVQVGEVEMSVEGEGSGTVFKRGSQRFELKSGENKIGRQADCAVIADDPSVSRYHASVLIMGDKVRIRDLGSTNGTMVNGRLLGEMELQPGDRVQLGDAELIFGAPEAAAGGGGPLFFQLTVDGKPRVLTPGSLKIGRALDCEISFSDDPEVSRHHSQLTVEARQVRARDLGSSNGTLVNGERIQGEVTLSNGDRIGVGSHEMIFQAEAPVSPDDKTVLAGEIPTFAAKTVMMPKASAGGAAAPAGSAVSDEFQAAAKVLDVPPTSSSEEFRQRYQELFSEYQVRLTNAPTPKLKEKYERKIVELREAFAVLVPESGGGPTGDLPSAKPIEGVEVAPPPAPSAPPQATPDQVPPDPGAAVVPSGADAVPAAAQDQKEGRGIRGQLPTSALVMSVIGLVAIGFAVVAGILMVRGLAVKRGLAAEVTAATEAVATMTEEIPRLEAELEELDRWIEQMLTNGSFQVCNLSGHDLRVVWLAVAYLDANNEELRTFDSAFFGYPTWTIGAGGSQKFDWVSGEKTVWDGSVLYYSLLFRYRGDEYFRSGSWKALQGDCYKLALDQ